MLRCGPQLVGVLAACLLVWVGVRPARAEGPGGSCVAAGCHAGIEPIRNAGSGMLRAISREGRKVGDASGCVICHGGDHTATSKEAAHRGAVSARLRPSGPQAFYADPGSPWVNSRTCGTCHPNQVFAQRNSLMMTEAGKIQGVAWAFGSLNGYRHDWGNYDARNPTEAHRRLGSEPYKAYMRKLKAIEPNVYPDRMTTVPAAPTDLNQLVEHPELAAFTYVRSECERCHLGVRGRSKRGDYRGMGCSACHVPYSNEGRYEGGDRTIPRDEPGHLLVHTIQATREAKVALHGQTYSGIPVETCTTCHDRGKRIGVSFQGLMESAYGSPYAADGSHQPALHTKHYIALHQDIHYQKGMMCPDCHTSIDVHGDGFLFGANLAQVQIECTDCHGTPTEYPWELPLGRGEEFEGDNVSPGSRGIARTLPKRLRQGTVYPQEDGYLLSARGNPLGNVVRQGDRVVVHTAGGKDILLEPLKLKARDGSLEVEARVAMVSVKGHLGKMECYACHGTWAPQCYGCHLKVDYSQGKQSFDWVAAGHQHMQADKRADRGEAGYATLIPGQVEEQRSYMRWAEPMLVVNGEGRVAPAAPGCQASVTVVGPEGDVIVANHIFRTTAHSEGSGAKGQLSLDMSPTQPHTTGRARSCETCHASPKALGHGIGGGRLNRPWNRPVVVDLMSADGRVLSKNARTQMAPIAGLADDWSRIVSEDGKQLMTVGHHFSRSRPLNDEQRQHMSREGICLACHQEIPGSLAVSVLHHVAQATGLLPTTRQAHHNVVHKLLLVSGWGQVLGLGLGLVVCAACVALVIRRRRRRR